MSNRTADLDLAGATEAFCARLSAEGRSPATIAAYRRDLALLARVAEKLAPGI
ncbi:MAG: integrase, partial [Gallionellales bacterium CG17_big_fil_post_rev_8_21_14_2_50_54_146]